jgi:hypothetical protein
VRVDDHLVPHLLAEDGARIDKLPKPTKKDDAKKAARAKEALQALSLDLDDIRATVFAHFERAMTSGRSWSAGRFRRTVVAHPLLGRVARSLVFEAYVQDVTRFVRVAEDGTFADANDIAVTLPDDAEVLVAHPLHFSETERSAFRRLFDDYALFAPFPQLTRETFTLTASEREATALVRFEGRLVATARVGDLFGLRGWQHGPHPNMVKTLGAREVHLAIHSRGSGASQIERVSLRAKASPNDDRPFSLALPFSLLSDVEASELLRDLETIPTA